MRIKYIFLCFLMIFIFYLSGCERDIHYDASDYILEMDYKEDFKILQMTDIHLANKDDRSRQYKFMRETINQANPDLIVVTGDSFTFADKVVAKELFAFFDEFGCKWTITLGNHDEQCYFSVDWLTDYLNSLSKSNESNCLFIDHQDDDISGNANFAINLMDGSTIKEQIIIMDSNRYNYGEYVGYDYIKENQIEWYESIVNYTKEQNGGSLVKSLLFFHIPLPEWDDAWKAYEEGSSDAILICGEKNEKSCPPDVNSGFFDKILELNSTDGIFVGHDHKNDFILKYKGIYLGYGVDATDRIYFESDMLGGTVITVKNDNSLEFNLILRDVSEYE